MTCLSSKRIAAGKAVAVLLCTLLIAGAAIVALGRLQADATTSRDGERQLVTLRLDMSQIQYVPWGAAPGEDEPASVADELTGDQKRIEQTIAKLVRGEGLPERRQILTPFRRSMAALWKIFHAVSTSDQSQASDASNVAARQTAVADQALQTAATRYRARSVRSLEQARLGTATVILLLFGAFAWFYWGSVRGRRAAESMAADNRRLAAASRREASTDALTGLHNRRALVADFDEAYPVNDERLLLVLYDLDGFKQYNDAFGHPAGDALLTRLGTRLAAAANGVGTAYRVGGDEFCILAELNDDSDVPEIARRGAAALSDAGPGFSVGCAYGVAVKAAIPDSILSKPSPLDAHEQAFIDSHAVVGERILRAAPSLAHTADFVRSHHEHFDGRGYPDGLAGQKIPLGARIIAVSEAFDAMICDHRPYHAAITRADALAELHRRAGSQFDPAVVEAFIRAIGDGVGSSGDSLVVAIATAGQ